MKTALIDADIFAYKWASASQETFKWGEGVTTTVATHSLEEACKNLAEDLDSIASRLKVDELVICLTEPDPTLEWRKILYPRYKAHRDPSKKPAYLRDLKAYLTENYKTYQRRGLEADDCLGILATHPTLIPGKKVVVTIDKDLLQIPGWNFNPVKDSKAKLITPEAGDYMHMYQTLVGDATDGYPGCPGIGPKKADVILSCCPPEFMWMKVVKAFATKGLTEDDALMQARVSRICQWQDYDYIKKEAILWQPPSGKASDTVGTKPGSTSLSAVA